MITISIKKRSDDGQWQDLPVGEIAGKTLLVFFQQSQGQEIVAEVNLNGRRLFFCGTDYWLERMQAKGEAVTFDDAIARLKKSNPALLAEKFPEMLKTVVDVFEGGTLTEHKIKEVQK